MREQVLFDGTISGFEFLQEYKNDEFCVTCILKKDHVSIAKLDFIYIKDKTFTKDDGTKVDGGKIVTQLDFLCISDSVKDKNAIVKKFIDILQMWGGDSHAVHRIEIYLNGYFEYEGTITEEGFIKVPYKDVYEHIQDLTKDKTCYLYKEVVNGNVNLNDIDKYIL